MNKLENPFEFLLENFQNRIDQLENFMVQKFDELHHAKPIQQNKPLRIEDAANYLGIKKTTLYALVSDRKIKPLKPSGHLLFTKSILEDYLKGNGRQKIDATKFIKAKNKKPQNES